MIIGRNTDFALSNYELSGENVFHLKNNTLKFDIIPEYSFVVGTPADTEEEVNRQIDFDIQFIREMGVGPGLGAALVRKFSREGLAVAIAARRVDKLQALAKETGGRAYACDATSEISVDDLFTAVERDLGLPRLVVFNAGAFVRKPVVELTPAEIESAWRACCLAIPRFG
jgi:hypothetical protein